MSTLKYVTIDRVFSKISRDLKGTETNEGDVIEWIGEALEFLEVPQILVEDVKFLKVVDYHTEMPEGLHMITQIAKHATSTPIAQNEEVLSDVDDPDFLNLDWTYNVWTSSDIYLKNYTPVRLATGNFFNTLVCKEKDDSLYNSCDDEYTIIGETEKKLRFNFIEGDVAVSFLKNSVDEETGYPLIPENISYLSAIVYYLKWKIAEMHEWAGRDGWASKADKAEVRWSKYARQAKNYMKMPKTLDQYQNLLEQSHNLIPNHNRYYNYFGNLGKRQVRNFQMTNKARY
jgi:hypothetical protein